MIVLVTGAAGFVGRRVVAAFADAGHTVRAGVHRRPLPPALAMRGCVTEVPCSLGDPAAVRTAAAGADVVVHAAYGGAPNQLVADVEALGRALAQDDGPRTLVSLSSIDVYGEASGTVTEATPAVAPLLPYGKGKQAAEAALEALSAQQPDRRTVALRIGCVVGAGSALWVDGLAARMADCAIGPMGPAGEGLAPMIDVDDLSGLIVAASTPRVPGHFIYNAVGDNALTWNAYFALVAAHLGVVVPPRPIGRSRVLSTLALPAKALRRVGVPGLVALSAAPRPGERRLFRRHARYDCTRALREIGWRPRFTADEAVARATAGEAGAVFKRAG